MFENIAKYYNAKADIHRINPVYKIISLLIFFILFIVTNNIMFSILMLLFSLLLILMTKVPFKLFIYRSIPTFLISIILLFFAIFFKDSINLVIKLIALSFYYSSYIYTTKLLETNKGIYDILKFIDIYNYHTSTFFIILIHFIQFYNIEFIDTYLIHKKRNLEIKNIFKLFYYAYLKLKNKIDIIFNIYKTRNYNFNYKKNNNLFYDLSLLGSHIMLFFVYFFGKI